MNRNIIQINDKYAAVSDEQGTIKVIKKENTDCDFEDILIKENDLDYLRKRLKMAYKHIEEINRDSKYANIFSILILIAEIVVFFGVSSTQVPIPVTIICMLAVYGCSKVFSLVEHGTRFTRHIRKKRVNERIQELEERIPELEMELQKMKEEAKYSVDYKINNDGMTIDHRQEFLHNLSEYAIDEQEETPIIVKDLSLTRKR